MHTEEGSTYPFFLLKGVQYEKVEIHRIDRCFDVDYKYDDLCRDNLI